MGHALVLDEAAFAFELDKALAAGRSGHAEVVGDSNQQRPNVEVAGLGARFDFEDGPARMVRVECVAVVHHALEHGQRPDPHGQ